ncbi:hypothetical protein [Clostridium botulinum]|uniref:hypothetical protein n=1 Tax=Clostridium botulinum TaxID=1491 RepID=UPI001E3B86F8|nr:hypothetical protein [Clostridium botulinum]MCD3223928.1 hypothetical protein [Clostridium botulinum C/D]MCD3297883.1 hypothetical protein [Clostridium botulinum C/D]
MDWITLIPQLGFPIVSCLALAWYLNKQADQQRQDNKEDKEKLYNNLEKLNQSNTEVVTTNRMLVENMQGDIKNIESKVDKLVEKVSEK